MITSRQDSRRSTCPLRRWRRFRLAAPAFAKGPVPDPAVKDFQRVVDAAYAKYKDLKDGKNADYIPILTETPSDLFGVVIVTKDGKVYSAGDVDYMFSIQSVSKPFTAALVMTRAGSGGAQGEDRRRAHRHGVQLEAGARGLRELRESAGQRRRDRGREPRAGDVGAGTLEQGAAEPERLRGAAADRAREGVRVGVHDGLRQPRHREPAVQLGSPLQRAGGGAARLHA